MKLLMLLLAMALPVSAEEFRTWTNMNGQKIEARIIDKKPDNSEARLSMKTGKSPWVKSATLSKEDVEYITAWKKKPMGFAYLTVTTASTEGNGYRTIHIVASAHDKPLITSVWKYASQSSPAKKTIPAGKTLEWDATVRADFRVSIATEDGEVMDEETLSKKTRE